MNKEEESYLPYMKAALEAQGYPADAVTLISESKWAEHIIGDSWRNHVPLELAQSHFQRRWLIGPMRCYWLWLPNMALEKLPQDVTTRAEETMKRRKKQEPVSGYIGSIYLGSGYASQHSAYKKPEPDASRDKEPVKRKKF